MKRLVTYFVNGIVTVAPIGLVAYIVIQLFQFIDNLLGQYLKTRMTEYIPGIGLVISVVLVTLIGWSATRYVSKSLLYWLERIVDRIPIIKSLYSIIKARCVLFCPQGSAVTAKMRKQQFDIFGIH
ncbi:DUF502 domain-containing protein [Effusibacillus dendaii]|uniref:DUF502 domain-containing protein n=1 Tax=Effusibacillus dendaii TaxID=2743772 RepID=A0A7I8DIH4_9BACL|nr:DUF502 domain-containing protein [Effusibacillus dendaii]BCJ88460.1 hypothetical protein skT53_34450 [Effusibacillus dendaii]